MNPRLPAIALAAVAVAVGGCGGGGAQSSTPAPSSASVTSPTSSSTVTAAASSSSAAPRRHRRRRVPASGSLPQTRQLPTAHTAEFRHEMDALWRGVQTNSLSAALPAFFPEAAYAQVKAISDPQADWRDRLVGTFRLDIGAAHALLSDGGSRARLVRVAVPAAYAHWVAPGACYNRIGYYEIPNARVVYRDGRSVRSFGIASMISWRGVWYVVHLGAVSGDATGTVDAPSSGPGTSAPSLTC